MGEKKRITRDERTLPGVVRADPYLPASGGGLTWKDYALAADKKDPSTWQLLHHTGERPCGGSRDMSEDTIDWKLMEIAVAYLSRMGYRGRRLRAGENEKIAAARHLAGHYRCAGRPLPNALAVLV